jgi:hypothetical protein
MRQLNRHQLKGRYYQEGYMILFRKISRYKAIYCPKCTQEGRGGTFMDLFSPVFSGLSTS